LFQLEPGKLFGSSAIKLATDNPAPQGRPEKAGDRGKKETSAAGREHEDFLEKLN
jgi:hypothetical protein